MPVRLHHIVIDTHDLPGLARFWTQALGWKVLSERENEIVIGTDENALVGICFMPVTDPKTVKNRVHLDLTSSAADRDREIRRLLALGARRVDIGQTGAEFLDCPCRSGGERVLRGAPEGNAHQLKLSTKNVDRPCPRHNAGDQKITSPFGPGIIPDHACDRGAARLDPGASRSQAYQPDADIHPKTTDV
jgi:catechol 2,3-dioxygenase-like lactoylglutathione lyase family enzyme